ncbi:hypothetical protein R1sor_011645 [Riccia sorocarpa]|uniref:Programmed cell death protein 2 C-terminal domain-containing protein n=1 Tax=Riccia sorocarpa TaxID=122646 RepID=A0ABD3I3C5_9MARC
MRKFSEQCARRSGTYFCCDKGVTSVAIKENKAVWLGLPGAWADERNEPADHYTTKVGGQPDWPQTVAALIKSDQLKCGACGDDLCLVTQVHAPLTADELNVPERTLYILGCPGQGCGISQTSWRTIRLQKNVLEDAAPELNSVDKPEWNDCSDSGVPDPVDSEWGGTSSRQDGTYTTHGDDWCGDNPWDGLQTEESSYEADSMNLQELQSSLTEAARVAATGSVAQNNNDTGRTHPVSSVRRNADHIYLPVLPCFYIYTQAEVIGVGPATSGYSQGALQSLGENEVPGDGGGDAGETWGSEDYEPDQALYADRTYLKFKKKLDHHPEQCFRYSFGGKPLYATDHRTDPAVCAACGGPRVFEMQLMPPLLYYLQQAHKDLPPSSYGPEEWEWDTVLIFSCAQSCVQEDAELLTLLGEKTGWSFVEEATILQQDLS